ncbi:MAG: carbon monoxide dehydrogenase, partial [Dehalococcoidia bacterium]|nr:carbon monoxide dehydrogenase [Dehalococcoidia bacterium]
MVEIEGEHRFEVAKEALWQALFDPAALRAALPAFESLERIDEDTYE